MQRVCPIRRSEHRTGCRSTKVIPEGVLNLMPSSHCFDSVLEFADNALSSASDIKSVTSVGTSQSFEDAVNELMKYVDKHHNG